MARAKTYLVSGAASGIGRHMARSLGREGANLVLTDIDEAGLGSLLDEEGWRGEARVATRILDVRDAAGWASLVAETVARFGSLDVMLNVAGYLAPGWVHEQSADEIDRHMDINAKGVMYATQAGARAMRAQGHGHIVNIGSMASIGHVPGIALYCASKHAVRGFSIAVAHELAADGVSVTVVCPDAVETPMLERQVAHEEAALVFGGGRGLRLEEIEAALRTALAKRPLELVVPIPGSGRGALAKLTNLVPSLASLGRRAIEAKGKRTQAARAEARSSSSSSPTRS